MRKLGGHPVDRAFDQGLQDASMPVSARIWDGINNQLEKERLHRKLAVYRWVAAASLSLLLAVGGWMVASQLTGRVLDGNGFASTARWCSPSMGLQLADESTPAAVADDRAGSDKRLPLGRQLLSLVGLRPEARPGVLDQILAPGQQLLPSKEQPEQAPAGASIVRRTPSLMGDFADNSRRSLPAWVTAPETVAQHPQKKEREFTYALDDREDEEDSPRRRLELGAGFAPDMSFASTTPVQVDARTSQIIADDPTEATTKRLSPVMAYSSGIKASYALNDRLALRSGVNYLYRESSTSESVNSFGKIDAYQSSLTLSTLELPLSLRYDVVDMKGFEYYVSGGVSGNFLLHYENEQITSTGKVAARRTSSDAEVMKPSAANLVLSTGVSYQLVERLNIQVEPGLRYGVKTNDLAFTQSRPLSMSLSTGLNYRF